MNASNMNKPSETDWERIEKLTDEEIDTSDIPPLDDTFFAKASLRMPRPQVPVTLHVNAERPGLDIYASAEASDIERSAIAESFGQGFEVSLHNGEYRFSEGVLPLVVTISLAIASNPVAVNIASNALWDLLKAGVLKLRSQPKSKINRETVIKIWSQEREFIIAKDSFFAREKQQQREYHSIDELFDDLKRH
ncbi:MAG: hypothetical protein AABO57_04430 [Acidobacteriota bacterium]